MDLEGEDRVALCCERELCYQILSGRLGSRDLQGLDVVQLQDSREDSTASRPESHMSQK